MEDSLALGSSFGLGLSRLPSFRCLGFVGKQIEFLLEKKEPNEFMLSLGNLGSIRFRGQERSVVQATQASVVNGRMETTIGSDVVNGHGGKELSLGAKNNITRDSNEIICIAQELQTHEEASEWTGGRENPQTSLTTSFSAVPVLINVSYNFFNGFSGQPHMENSGVQGQVGCLGGRGMKKGEIVENDIKESG
ncbi:hypothetical protein F2Q69_00001303 [Brassica cretica]|uniref:Uncharacterized protein n=1 Tax=Brassica cretica TaxID=69181 RepID=A0A8S9P9V2_BRACR|nr:hypothetical protein F2Q69_00001303 [Brassica cretica]